MNEPGTRTVRCRACLSYSPERSPRCLQCGRPFSPVVLLLRNTAKLIAGLLLVAGLVAGMSIWSPETPSVEPDDTQREADPIVPSVPTVTPDEGVKTPTKMATSPILGSPPLYRVESFDVQGVPLHEGFAVHVDDGVLMTIAGVLRGADRARVMGHGDVAYIGGVLDQLVLVGVSEVLSQDTVPMADGSMREGQTLYLPALGSDRTVSMLSVTMNEYRKDAVTGFERIVFSPTVGEPGAPLIDEEGRLCAVVLGISSEGPGLAIPTSAVRGMLARRVGWSFSELRRHTHETDASSRLDLANVYAQKGKSFAALREMEAAVALDPSLSAEMKNARIDLHRAVASQLAREGRTREARRYLEDALRLDQRNALVYRDLGLMFLMDKNPRAAVQKMRYAIQLESTLTEELRTPLIDAYLALGRSAIERGDFRLAVEELSRGIALYPENGHLQLALGNAYAAESNWRGALEAYRTALAVDTAVTQRANEGIDRAMRAMELGGPIEIRFPRGSKTVTVGVGLEGRVKTKMIVDTGASTTVITKGVALRLGIRNLDRADKVPVMTANGPIEAPAITLSKMTLQGALIRDVEVLVVDQSDWSGAEGLIGLNVLDRFKVALDVDGGRLTLTPR